MRRNLKLSTFCAEIKKKVAIVFIYSLIGAAKITFSKNVSDGRTEEHCYFRLASVINASATEIFHIF